MIIKNLLNIFFRHPVKGLPVVSAKDGKISGVIQKDRIIEISSGNRTDLTRDVDCDPLLQDLTESRFHTLFDGLKEEDEIPLIDKKGAVVKTLTRKDLWKLVEVPPAVPEPPKAPSRAASSYRPPDGDYGILDCVNVPVLVTNSQKVIQFANETFLASFDLAKDFIIHQKISHFFPKIKMDKVLSGTFGYQHKKWSYRISYLIDRIFIIFFEARPPSPNPVVQDVEKIMKGKENLRSLLEKYESALIKKIHQRTRNTPKTAKLLGITEEKLKYRMGRSK